MSFLYQVAQNWTQFSRCHLRSAEKRGVNATLDVLATLLLIELRILLALLAAQTYSRVTAEMHPTRASAACISARSKRSALLLYWWPCFWIRNPELSPEFSWQLQTCYLLAEKNYTYRHLKCAVYFNLMLGTTKWHFVFSDRMLHFLLAHPTPTGFFSDLADCEQGTF